jgi:metal-dependent amidase/aminoacylase/carboxypeptidase family protein
VVGRKQRARSDKAPERPVFFYAWSGGEDFAVYLQQIPGAFVSIGSASPFGLHHPAGLGAYVDHHCQRGGLLSHYQLRTAV